MSIANIELHLVLYASPLYKKGNSSMNATLTRVRITIIAVEKRCVTYSVCFRSFSYSAFKAHAPYICGLSVSTIFFHSVS